MAKQQCIQVLPPSVLEFGTDTVYERTNIVKICIPEIGECWEYDEVQYTYPEYARRQQQQIDEIMLAQVELAVLTVGGGNNG